MTQHLAFVVSKIGVNAELTTDPNDFIFHSDYNTFKIIREATKQVTLSASTNNQSFSEPHGQFFIPIPAAFAKEPSLSQVFLPNGGNVTLWGPKLGFVTSGITFNYVKTDAINITFNFDNTNVTAKLVNVRYFLLEKI